MGITGAMAVIHSVNFVFGIFPILKEQCVLAEAHEAFFPTPIRVLTVLF